MKENTNIKDCLREAIRHEESARPAMPTDLNARLMRRMEKEATRKQGRKPLRTLWPWIAAACVAACAITLLAPLDNTKTDNAPVANKTNSLATVTAPEPSSGEKTMSAEKPCSQATADKGATDGRETKNEARAQDITITECPERAECDLAAVEEPSTSIAAENLASLPPEASAISAAEEHATSAAEEDVASAAEEHVASATETPAAPAVTPKPRILTERDIPITRAENMKYTKEEIALMKKQANEAYLKWMELELEIAKYKMEQTANNNR